MIASESVSEPPDAHALVCQSKQLEEIKYVEVVSVVWLTVVEDAYVEKPELNAAELVECLVGQGIFLSHSE